MQIVSHKTHLSIQPYISLYVRFKAVIVYKEAVMCDNYNNTISRM